MPSLKKRCTSSFRSKRSEDDLILILCCVFSAFSRLSEIVLRFIARSFPGSDSLSSTLPGSFDNSPEYRTRCLGSRYGLPSWIYVVGKSSVSSRRVVGQSYSLMILVAPEQSWNEGYWKIDVWREHLYSRSQGDFPREEQRTSPPHPTEGCSEDAVTTKIHCHTVTAFSG